MCKNFNEMVASGEWAGRIIGMADDNNAHNLCIAVLRSHVGKSYADRLWAMAHLIATIIVEAPLDEKPRIIPGFGAMVLAAVDRLEAARKA